MNKPEQRYGIDPYLEWVTKEGVPVVEDYGVDLFALETDHWPRYGMKGAAAHLKGRGDFASMFLFEISPGGSSSPQHHLYEEIVYVLEGTGSTQLEFGDGSRRSFEWGPRSMFAIPLNARYRYFNGSGQHRALIVSTTDLPLVMNTFHNESFVFDTDFAFSERIGKDEYYSGEGDLTMIRAGNHIWETNFVPDLMQLELPAWSERGAGAGTMMFQLADGIMHAHVSEMPAGTYKKAHRHLGGAHVMFVEGQGYSLAWFEGDKDFMRVDWRHGIVFPSRRAASSAFQYQQSGSTLPRDDGRQSTLPLHRGQAARRRRRRSWRQERRRLEYKGGRGPGRIRRPGSAHPSHVAR